MSGKGDAGMPMPLPDGVRRSACYGVALPWLAFTVVVYLFAFAGGFVQTWGRDYTPTLRHFITAFGIVRQCDVGAAWCGPGTAWNSLVHDGQAAGDRGAAHRRARPADRVAAGAQRVSAAGALFEFGALLAFAIPGTVLGVSYILAFNVPPFELTGTGLIIVLCFMFRNLPVGVRAGTAAFKQIDRSLDEASMMLRARHRDDAAPRRAAAAEAGARRRAGLQLRARDDHGVGGDLPRHGRERTGDDLHHRPRRQRRLRRRARLLHGADRADVARDRADPVAGRRAQARPARSRCRMPASTHQRAATAT